MLARHPPQGLLQLAMLAYVLLSLFLSLILSLAFFKCFMPFCDCYTQLSVMMACSRSIGDVPFKRFTPPLLSPIPDVRALRLRPGHRFLLLISDGVSDVLSHSAAIAIAGDELRRQLGEGWAYRPIARGALSVTAEAPRAGANGYAPTSGWSEQRSQDAAQAAASKLAKAALNAGSQDNITAVVVLFQWC
jgi:serine/threonine protein phosphatase PrpC